MMTQVINESTNAAVAQQSPGYLMTPFGWVAEPPAAMLEADSLRNAVCKRCNRVRGFNIEMASFSYVFPIDLMNVRKI
jgi:hypothetical protein